MSLICSPTHILRPRPFRHRPSTRFLPGTFYKPTSEPNCALATTFWGQCLSDPWVMYLELSFSENYSLFQKTEGINQIVFTVRVLVQNYNIDRIVQVNKTDKAQRLFTNTIKQKF